MRIKELLVEYKAKASGTSKGVSADANAALPGVFVQHQLRNTDPYMQMRYGVALAAALAHQSGEVDFDQETAWSENVSQVLYAPEEEKTVKLASKMMGVTPTKIANNKSQEPKHISTTSPVANVKKNKYGV